MSSLSEYIQNFDESSNINNELALFIWECEKDEQDRPRFMIVLNASQKEAKTMLDGPHSIEITKLNQRIRVKFEQISPSIFYTRCNQVLSVPIAKLLNHLLGHSDFILTEITPFSVFKHLNYSGSPPMVDPQSLIVIDTT